MEQIFIGLFIGVGLTLIFVSLAVITKIFLMITNINMFLGGLKSALTEDLSKLYITSNTILDMVEEMGYNNENAVETSVKMFRSLDGKHTAPSLEDLMKKMMNDPEYEKDDIDNLRQMFQDEMDEGDEQDGFLK